MSALKRLAQANALRCAVENVNRVRANLGRRPHGDDVEIAMTVRACIVDCGGESRVETWQDFGPSLGQGGPGVTVRILAGSPPADVRACLERIAADYETAHEQITARAEEVASAVLDVGTADDDIPF